jgi:hypothetical protein
LPASIFGLVIGADNYLLQYESSLRAAENDIRRQARNALAREGRIATEGEIRRWRIENKEILEASTKVKARSVSEGEGVRERPTAAGRGGG